MSNREYRRLDLTPEQWKRLDELAHETHSRAAGGRRAKQPTWAALIRAIAQGKLKVVGTYENPVELTPEMEAEWERQRQEWLRRRQQKEHDAPIGRYSDLKYRHLHSIFDEEPESLEPPSPSQPKKAKPEYRQLNILDLVARQKA